MTLYSPIAHTEPRTDTDITPIERAIIAEVRRINKSCRQCQVVIRRNQDGTWQVYEATPTPKVQAGEAPPVTCCG
jgi:hypothetical protein